MPCIWHIVGVMVNFQLDRVKNLCGNAVLDMSMIVFPERLDRMGRSTSNVEDLIPSARALKKYKSERKPSIIFVSSLHKQITQVPHTPLPSESYPCRKGKGCIELGKKILR